MPSSSSTPEQDPGFFEAGVDYTTRADAYKAPEQINSFRCIAVGEHPEDGTPRAFGFARAGLGAWYVAALPPDAWLRHGWRPASAPFAESGGVR